MNPSSPSDYVNILRDEMRQFRIEFKTEMKELIDLKYQPLCNDVDDLKKNKQIEREKIEENINKSFDVKFDSIIKGQEEIKKMMENQSVSANTKIDNLEKRVDVLEKKDGNKALSTFSAVKNAVISWGTPLVILGMLAYLLKMLAEK